MSERLDSAICYWLSRSAVRNAQDGSPLNAHLERLLRQVAMNVAAYNTGDCYYRETDIVAALEASPPPERPAPEEPRVSPENFWREVWH